MNNTNITAHYNSVKEICFTIKRRSFGNYLLKLLFFRLIKFDKISTITNNATKAREIKRT